MTNISALLNVIDIASITRTTEWAVARDSNGEAKHDTCTDRDTAFRHADALNSFLASLDAAARRDGDVTAAVVVSREIRMLPDGWHVTGPWVEATR